MSDEPKQTAGTEPSEPASPVAWQPFTPDGVAAFAGAPWGRVVILQLIAAVLAASVVVWFIQANYFPAISEAIENLPDGAVLENRVLTHVPSGILTEKSFLSFSVDLEGTGQTGRTADLQVELRQNYFQICSLFGCGVFDYPTGRITLGRSTFEPWWGARQPIALALCGLVTFVQVWLSWFLLGLLYAPLAKLIAYFADRQLSWCGSLRLALSAQMTGALLMCLAIFLYGIQAFDLIRFLFFFGLHFAVAWIYLGTAPYFLPRATVKNAVAKNPFGNSL